MQFKHPEILYALFLLLIPIIVHLFQLRRFKKVDFTNVAFLKKATLQTRKSSQIKKWLVLITRLLLLTVIIFAFAQPFTSKSNSLNTKNEMVIYLDNSFSMQAKGNKGELLKRAVQDIIANAPEDDELSIITNNAIFKKTTIKAVKNDLLQLDYASTSLPAKAALLKGNTLFNMHNKSQKHLVFISDFQNLEIDFEPTTDSLTHLHLVKLQPVNTNNVAIDSAYISNSSATALELTVKLKNSGNLVDNVSVSLYNNDKLIAKSSVEIEDTAQTTFTLPVNTAINGKIVIDDTSLQFDNTLFFNINNTEKINVLAINGADDHFLKRIYTPNEFNYTGTGIQQLDYNILSNQQLIVLNELEQIPSALISALQSFTEQGGTMFVVPSTSIVKPSYNALLLNYNMAFNDFIPNEKHITSINFSHPLYNNGVFEKQVNNFQYPKVNGYYPLRSNTASSALKFENGSSFLSQYNNAFVFASALNNDDSNFTNSPLIVPTLYNIGKFSLNLPNLYFTIGRNNSFDIATQLEQDDILQLSHKDTRIIPRQQQFNNKVIITTLENPTIAGTYTVTSKAENLSAVSYNYSREESDLVYKDLSNLEHLDISNSITNVFSTIKSDTKINALWKWFVIFALILLILEMLILKYFK